MKNGEQSVFSPPAGEPFSNSSFSWLDAIEIKVTANKNDKDAFKAIFKASNVESIYIKSISLSSFCSRHIQDIDKHCSANKALF